MSTLWIILASIAGLFVLIDARALVVNAWRGNVVRGAPAWAPVTIALWLVLGLVCIAQVSP